MNVTFPANRRRVAENLCHRNAIAEILRCLRRFFSDRESTRINANKEGSSSLKKTKLRESFQATDLTFLLLKICVHWRQFAVVPSVAAEPPWANRVFDVGFRLLLKWRL